MTILAKILLQFKFFVADIKRWKWSTLNEVFYNSFEPGLWVVVLYRFSRILYLINIPVLRIFTRLITFFVFKFSELILGVAISASTDIGPGLYIGHVGIIRIHPDVKAGKNLSIGQLVTIGTKGVGHKGVPSIGDNVYMGVGAKILGNIKIGNNVKIGANSVVVNDLPDYATAVGIPARIVKIETPKVTI